jgi:hypothetical protein
MSPISPPTIRDMSLMGDIFFTLPCYPGTVGQCLGAAKQRDKFTMGALTIVLWITALAGGVFFPPLFIAPMFSTYLWLRQKDKRNTVAKSLKENFRKCPRCAEIVKKEALICKHCRTELAVTA